MNDQDFKRLEEIFTRVMNDIVKREEEKRIEYDHNLKEKLEGVDVDGKKYVVSA